MVCFCSPIVQAMDLAEKQSSTKTPYRSLYEDIADSHLSASINSSGKEHSEGHDVSRIDYTHDPYLISSRTDWKECSKCINMVKVRNEEFEELIDSLGRKTKTLLQNDAQDMDNLQEINTLLMKENTNLFRQNAELKRKITDLEAEREDIYERTAEKQAEALKLRIQKLEAENTKLYSRLLERKEESKLTSNIVSSTSRKYCPCGARYLGLNYCVACNQPRI